MVRPKLYILLSAVMYRKEGIMYKEKFRRAGPSNNQLKIIKNRNIKLISCYGSTIEMILSVILF